MKMNSIKGFLTVAVISAAGIVFAQDKDPVLMTIAGKNITRSEFQSIYNKNNPKNTEADSKSIDDYVQLFVNFKLKVKEAEAYERSKTDVRASHILIKLDASALPKDTLKAYNTTLALRTRILKGEDFAKVARENS